MLDCFFKKGKGQFSPQFIAILLKINSRTMALMSFGIMSMMPKFAYRSL